MFVQRFISYEFHYAGIMYIEMNEVIKLHKSTEIGERGK